MNIYQRVVLIVGAIALIIGIFTTPKYIMHSSGVRVPPHLQPSVPTTTDLETGLLRVIGIIGATLFITYALKDKKASDE